jgi:hypothetical protein
VESGVLEIYQYDPIYVAGSFALQFEGGNYLNGHFELSGPMYGGVVTITDGFMYGPVMPETAPGMIWYAGMEHEWASSEIKYIDEDRDVGLNLSPHFGPMQVGTFSVPDQIWVNVNDFDDTGTDFESEAVSGTVVITSYQEDVGIAGHFENMMFPEGTLSGSFDVSFQTTEYE